MSKQTLDDLADKVELSTLKLALAIVKLSKDREIAIKELEKVIADKSQPTEAQK